MFTYIRQAVTSSPFLRLASEMAKLYLSQVALSQTQAHGSVASALFCLAHRLLTPGLGRLAARGTDSTSSGSTRGNPHVTYPTQELITSFYEFKEMSAVAHLEGPCHVHAPWHMYFLNVKPKCLEHAAQF